MGCGMRERIIMCSTAFNFLHPILSDCQRRGEGKEGKFQFPVGNIVIFLFAHECQPEQLPKYTHEQKSSTYGPQEKPLKSRKMMFLKKFLSTLKKSYNHAP